MNEEMKYDLFEKIKNRGYWQEIPGRQERVENFVKQLFSFFFPSCNECVLDHKELEKRYLAMKDTLVQFYCPFGAKNCNIDKSFENEFLKHLPDVYNLLYCDAKAIFNGDPAAKTVAEIVHVYPGFYATFIHRIAHVLYDLEWFILARILSEYAHSLTGVDIHPGAKIGHSLSIDHGTGIVIGETAIIGNNVKLYQGVTLGAKSVEKRLANSKRHPTIENDVVIYSGATILGGDTNIGQGSTIGGNVFLTHSVAENSLVYQKSEVKIKEKKKLEEELC